MKPSRGHEATRAPVSKTGIHVAQLLHVLLFCSSISFAPAFHLLRFENGMVDKLGESEQDKHRIYE
jgi:hypothetical protein